MQEKVIRRFYWADASATSKGLRERFRGEIRQYIVGTAFKRIVVGVVGSFPEAPAENRYFILVVIYFTKWPEISSTVGSSDGVGCRLTSAK